MPTLLEKPVKKPISCPLCDADQFKVLYRPRLNETDPTKLYGAASGIQGTQQLVQCQKCTFIYENPRLSEADIIDGYSSSIEEGHDSQFEMRIGSFYRALQKLNKKIPGPKAKVLDVGSAGGAFLEAARRFGYDAVGLEPSQYLVDSAQKRNLKVQQGTLSTAPWAEKTFDMICFWDVLEHVTEPKKELALARKLLKPNGVLLVNYPDIGTGMAKLAGERFWWILSVHLTHFDKKTMDRCLNATGFQSFYQGAYWQTLQFGYLLEVSKVYVPAVGNFASSITPGFIKKIPVPYYASQTTCLARKSQ